MSATVPATAPAAKAAPATATVEVWVVADENGDFAIGADQAAALAKYDEDIGRDDDSPLAMRWARITLTVPLPTVAELVGTVPAEGEALLSVA